ncbi:HDIG domain-containing protein [Marinilabiliaceae bacterium JC017]|nr:HDIG domain-containing protein [Marinilabiliaceae bacterium JC017]
MIASSIIDKYYQPGSKGWTILTEHSKAVRDLALEVITKHPELHADASFVSEAAMLHDIGIFMTNAAELECFGPHPYICHGYLGRELLDKEGLHDYALVCERHTGAGLSLGQIIDQKLPVPGRDMLPVSVEEEIICFADKFFSKSRELTKAKSIKKIRSSMEKHGQNQIIRFNNWCERFL